MHIDSEGPPPVKQRRIIEFFRGLLDMSGPLKPFDYICLTFVGAALVMSVVGVLAVASNPVALPHIGLDGGSSSERANAR
jgi:hypothetical protein